VPFWNISGPWSERGPVWAQHNVLTDKTSIMNTTKFPIYVLFGLLLVLTGCQNGGKGYNGALSSSHAEKVYVDPGEHDEFYVFLSGGCSANLHVYGLPSGRMFKEIPVFSQLPTSGYGYSE